jgi:hypothetical protein
MVASFGNVMDQRHDGDVEFYAAEPDDLDRVTSSPQAFDNQWLPGELLAQVMGPSRPTAKRIENRRQRFVRNEYIRALVNTGQLVINRAYIYNNKAIYADYLRKDAERENFKSLLAKRIVIPYLYNEPSPASPPIYTVSKEGYAGWLQVLKESAPTCVRLSWDDSENATQARRFLASPFGQFLKNMNDLEVPLLAAEFGLSQQDADAFAKRLRQVADWAHSRSQAGERLNREDFYEKFVTADESDPIDRLYDRDKPFAAQLKQLADLRYNANLPDALGSYLLTPDGSLRRRALQEWRELRRTTETDAAQIMQVVSNLRFDQVSAVQGAPAAFNDLDLGGVLELRSTAEWDSYHGVLNQFLNQPTLDTFTDADHGAEAVAVAYRDVIEEAGKIARGRRAEAIERRWDPVIEITVEFAGAILSLFYNPSGSFFRVARDIAPGVSTKTAKAVFHLVIGRAVRSRARSRVDNSIRVLDTRLEHGKRDWEEFVSGLRKQGFRDLDRDPGAAAKLGSMERETDE